MPVPMPPYPADSVFGVPDSCPKCGQIAAFTGPVWQRVRPGVKQSLAWTCKRCRYVLGTKALDELKDGQ